MLIAYDTACMTDAQIKDLCNNEIKEAELNASMLVYATVFDTFQLLTYEKYKSAHEKHVLLDCSNKFEKLTKIIRKGHNKA